MNDILITIICIFGLVFIILPTFGFIVWLAIQYIKFAIEMNEVESEKGDKK